MLQYYQYYDAIEMNLLTARYIITSTMTGDVKRF